MKRVLLASLVGTILVCAVAGSPVTSAQTAARPGQGTKAAQPATTTPTPRNWYAVTVVTVKPESANDWIEFQKSQTMPMQQKAGIKMRETWQGGAPFGQAFTYATITPIDKFADFDEPPLLVRTLGAEAARAYQDKLRPMIVSSHTYGMQDRAELSIQPAPTAKIVGGVLTHVSVVSGHADQYEAYIKNDVLPVLKKGNVLGYSVVKTIFGGDANEYITVQLFDSFAEIDKGPVAMRVLGQAGAQALAAKATPHIASMSREIIRYVPDLSFHVRPSS